MCILHRHAQIPDELDVPVSWKCLGKSVRDHFFCWLDLERDHCPCDLFTQKVTLDVDVLRVRMINRVLGQRDAPLTVLKSRRRYLGAILQVFGQTSTPNRFLRRAVQTHVLCLSA